MDIVGRFLKIDFDPLKVEVKIISHKYCRFKVIQSNY